MTDFQKITRKVQFRDWLGEQRPWWGNPIGFVDTVCSTSLNLFVDIVNPEYSAATGNYNRLTHYTGGTFYGCWYDSSYEFHPNETFSGDGRYYASYGLQTDEIYYQLVFVTLTPSFTYYRIIASTGDYEMNGGQRIGSIGLEPDGRLYPSIGDIYYPIAGDFATGNLVSINYPALCNPSFCLGTGFDDYTYSVVEDHDSSKIIVAGVFDYYQGHYSPNVVRIDKITGEVDTTFTSPILYGQTIYGCKPSTYFPGKYYVYGAVGFVSSNGGIARLNNDGSYDTTFTATTINSSINDFVELSDGKLIHIGNYTSPKNRILSLNTNGTTNATFNITTGFNTVPYQISLSSDGGDVFVNGAFLTYNGTTSYRLAKINSTTGAINTTFTTGISTIFNGQVTQIDFDGDGNIWCVGQFTNYTPPVSAFYIWVVDPISGTSITQQNFGNGFSFNNYPHSIKYNPYDNTMLVLLRTSTFTSNVNNLDGTDFYGKICSINCFDGSLDGLYGSTTNINYGFDDVMGGNLTLPNDIYIDENNNSYIVGQFSRFSEQRYDRFIKLDPYGQSITTTNC